MNVINTKYNAVEDLAEIIASHIEEHIMDDASNTMYEYYQIMDKIHIFAEDVAQSTQDLLRKTETEVLGMHIIHDDMYASARSSFKVAQILRQYESESCEDKPIRRAPTFY